MADVDLEADIVERLNEACVGRPHAKIPWPHRLLHDARDEIARLRDLGAELERVKAERDAALRGLDAEGSAGWVARDKLEAAEARLAEATAITDDAIERVAKALDPEIWAVDGPIPTRANTEDFYKRRNRSTGMALIALRAFLTKEPDNG